MNGRVSRRSNGCFMGIFAVIGLVLLAVAVGSWSVGSRFRSGALRTQGTVIRMSTRSDSEGARQRLPVVQYGVDTQTYEIKGKVSSSPPAYHVGDSVTVLYPPEKPAEGQIDSFLEQRFLPVLLGGIGTVFCLVGVLGVLFLRR